METSFISTVQRYDVFLHSTSFLDKKCIVCVQNTKKEGWLSESIPLFVMLALQNYTILQLQSYTQMITSYHPYPGHRPSAWQAPSQACRQSGTPW